MARQKNQLYEGMYIFNTTLSNEAREKLLNKVTESIVSKGGEVHKIFDQGRKKLAYEIAKKREGHYFLLFFSVPTNAIKDLWREYRLNEDIIRFITLCTDNVPEKIEFQPLPK